MRERIDEQNCVATIQPYTINHTMCYYRSKSCLESGISMLYTFENHNKGYTVVSDACADIMIYYDEKKEDIGMDLVGPHDHLEYLDLKKEYRYLGIRFLPGYSPTVAGAQLYDLKGEIVPICNKRLHSELLQKVQKEDDFLEQCAKILQSLNLCKKAEFMNTNQTMIYQEILNLILCSDKTYSLKELEHYTGYSARYLNKIFSDRTGYSIIQFSNILRAQRICGCLERFKNNKKQPMYHMIAAELGYSDQSHMIREFRKYFGMTPKIYYQNYC